VVAESQAQAIQFGLGKAGRDSKGTCEAGEAPASARGPL